MFLWQVLCKLATKLLVGVRQTCIHTGKQHIEESQVLLVPLKFSFTTDFPLSFYHYQAIRNYLHCETKTK